MSFSRWRGGSRFPRRACFLRNPRSRRRLIEPLISGFHRRGVSLKKPLTSTLTSASTPRSQVTGRPLWSCEPRPILRPCPADETHHHQRPPPAYGEVERLGAGRGNRAAQVHPHRGRPAAQGQLPAAEGVLRRDAPTVPSPEAIWGGDCAHLPR